jgi:hypothetical protein
VEDSSLAFLLIVGDEEAKWDVDVAVNKYWEIKKAITCWKTVLRKQTSGLREFELI